VKSEPQSHKDDAERCAYLVDKTSARDSQKKVKRITEVSYHATEEKGNKRW